MDTHDPEGKPRISILLGLPFHNLSKQQAAQEFLYALKEERPHYFVFANTETALRANRNDEIKKLFFYADRVFCSSKALFWLSRLIAAPIQEYLPRHLVFNELFNLCKTCTFNFFLLGSTNSNIEIIAPLLKKQYPNINIVGSEKIHERAQSKTVFSKIQRKKPDILIVAFDKLSEETWIYSNYRELNIPITIGSGGNFLNILSENTVTDINYIKKILNNIYFISKQLFIQRWAFKRPQYKAQTRVKKDILSTEAFYKLSWSDNIDRSRLQILPSPPNYHRHIILECSSVSFIDSMGLGKLVQMARRAKKENKLFALLKPSKVITKAIESMQLEKLIPQFFSTSELQDHFKRHEENFVLVKKNLDIEGYTIKPLVSLGEKAFSKIEQIIQDLSPKLTVNSKIILSLEHIDDIDSDSISNIINIKNNLNQKGILFRLSMVHGLPQETLDTLELKKILVSIEPIALEIVDE